MTQKLRYFCTLLLMAVVGVAWADEESVVFSEQGYSNGDAVESYEGTNFSIAFNKGTNSNNAPKYYGTGSAIRAYGGNYFIVSSENTITKIELTFSSGEGSNAITTDVETYNNGTWEGSANEVKFTIGGTSGHRRIAGITVTYETGVSTSLATTTSIDATGITNTDVYVSTEAGSLTATVTETESGAAVSGATVTWTSSNESVATIASDGTVTLVAAGSTTFTASYAGVEDEYKASSATYQLTVTNSDPNAPGTENNPYTVAQARAAIDANTGVTGVYATGIVSEIVTPLNTQYGNISYNISVDGTTTADQLQAFRGKSYNGEIFTSADDIKVGDEVVVYGNLKKFNTTYEFDADNQLVSLNRPVSEDPAVTLDEYTIDVPVEGGEDILTVDYQNIDDVVADVQFYDENGNEVDADYYEAWLTASLDEGNNVNYIAIENNGEERKAYFKVYALVGDNSVYSEVYSDMITITQAAKEAANVTWNLSIDETATASTTEMSWTSDFATMKVEKAGAGTNTNNYYPGSATPRTSTRFYNGSELTIAPKLGYTITKVEFTATSENYASALGGSEWTNATAAVDGTNVTVTPTNGNLAMVATIGGTCGFTGVKVYYEESDVMVIKIKEGFTATTFSCDKALDFSAVEGITAYIITDDKGSTTLVTNVRAGEGLYIVGAEGYYEVPIIANADEISGNLLEATDGSTVYSSGNTTYYAFGKQNGKEAFYKVPTSGYTPSANKAVLVVNAPASGAKEMIVIGGDVTGIESIENGTIVNDNYYTIDGKLVKGQPTQKGIYVVNGRKVVIK